MPRQKGVHVWTRTLILRLRHSEHPFLDFRCALRRCAETGAEGSFIGETDSICGLGIPSTVGGNVFRRCKGAGGIGKPSFFCSGSGNLQTKYGRLSVRRTQNSWTHRFQFG